MTKEKLQEKYILYQLLNQNLESLRQQMELVEQQFIEIRSTMLSIDDLERISKDNEIFLPLGSGCFGKGQITDNRDILVNIGAGIFVNKKLPAARSSLEKMTMELENAGNEIHENIERISRQMNEIGMEIQKLAKREEKP